MKKRFVSLIVLFVFVFTSLAGRCAYIALGIYGIIGVLWWKPRSAKWKLGLAMIATFLLTYGLCPAEVQTTLQMNRTVSQQQSTGSRIHATQAAWDAFCERPLVGYGSNNFTYAVDATLNQDSTRPYTSFAPNIVVQLLVEKGLVGTLLYAGLAVSLIVCIGRRRNEAESRIIACTLLAVGIKDLTQATWLSTPFTLWMSYVFFAFLPRDEEKMRTVSLPWLRYLLPAWAGLYLLAWNMPSWKQYLDPTAHQLRRALEAMEQPETRSEAARLLTAVEARHPEDIQIRYLQARLLLWNGAPDSAAAVW